MAQIKITDGAGVDRLWPYASSKNRHVQSLETSCRVALSSKQAIEDHQVSVRADGRLTERGVVDEVRRYGKSEVVPAVAKAALAVQRARDAVAAKRSQLTAPAMDKTDAVSFFKRESIRDSIRNMPRGQRDELLVRNLDKLSPQALQAVLEEEVLPWVQESDKLVSDKTRDAIGLHLIRATHPAAIAEIAEIERAVEYAQPTIDKAALEIQSSLAMRGGEFLAAVEAEAAANPVKMEIASPPVAASNPVAAEYETRRRWPSFGSNSTILANECSVQAVQRNEFKPRSLRRHKGETQMKKQTRTTVDAITKRIQNSSGAPRPAPKPMPVKRVLAAATRKSK